MGFFALQQFRQLLDFHLASRSFLLIHYKNVHVVEGSLESWQAQGHPFCCRDSRAFIFFF